MSMIVEVYVFIMAFVTDKICDHSTLSFIITGSCNSQYSLLYRGTLKTNEFFVPIRLDE